MYRLDYAGGGIIAIILKGVAMHYTLVVGHVLFRGTRPLPSVVDDNHRRLGSSRVFCGSPLASCVFSLYNWSLSQETSSGTCIARNLKLGSQSYRTLK